MPRKRAEEAEPIAEGPKEDPFMVLLEKALTAELERCVEGTLEPKERNGVFANAIKFILVKGKTSDGDDGSFFGD